MLLSLETSIKPQISWLYRRLLVLLGLLSIVFLRYADLSWPLTLLLLVGLILYLVPAYTVGLPEPALKELRITPSHWIMVDCKDQSRYFDTARLLLHNPLFQLLLLTGPLDKKHVVLFQDQCSKEQLRLLHIKAGIQGK